MDARNGHSLIAYFKKYETYIDYGQEDPQPGDMFHYGYKPNPDVTVGGEPNDMGHVALVVSYDSSTKTITTIGGNESDTISTKTYKIGADGMATGFGSNYYWIAGYGRIKQ